jgi:hypothetical protein
MEIAADWLKDGELQFTQVPAHLQGAEWGKFETTSVWTLCGQEIQTRRPDLQVVEEIS